MKKAKTDLKTDNKKPSIKTGKSGKPIKLRIGIVTARFNSEITDKLEAGAMQFLETLEGYELKVFNLKVPGAVEIPLACQLLLENQKCDGVVALGAVIRGDTSHYDYVCQSVTDGVTRLMLDYQKPIGFGILTTDTAEQALSRCGLKGGNKGREAADTALAMVKAVQKLKEIKKAVGA